MWFNKATTPYQSNSRIRRSAISNQLAFIKKMDADEIDDFDLTLDVDKKDEVKQQQQFVSTLTPEEQSLKKYYDEKFPWDLLYEWLSFNHFGDSSDGQSEYFGRREFSVSYTRPDKQIVLRNRSSPDVNNIKLLINDLLPATTVVGASGEVKRKTIGGSGRLVYDKLDIGPVYNSEPIKKDSVTSYSPVERELVFDIDINDYDEVRACCKGQTLCSKCWGLLALAADYLTYQINECFGFEQFLYVFSGGRGLHIWISDKSAVTLTYEMRKSLVSFLRMDHSSDYLHPQIEFFLKYFEEHMIEDQLLLSDEKQLKQFLEQFPESYGKKKINIRESVERVLEENSEVSSDVEKWMAIKASLATLKENIDLQEIIFRVVMYYTHPRIDEPVTIGFNHLLKSPFCIHPRTKKLCVPIELSEIHKFDPNNVPTLNSILNINQDNNNNNNNSNQMDIDDESNNKKKKKSKNQDNNTNDFQRYRKQFSLYN
ncbi:DNA polymerase alpha primase subunit [Heterostelium album PN500]|uniref:DNA primase n=1 Tax=Heterostelium pallidum (strain ATCC 26659 / Pp 5 / PN500) TaxID=670386 RepID=D3BAC6_HETP5|nr:DNA polymerase alpha primase subunit [Heterostelium album PN500]EFA81513.1 DNA polymerase alpha primase subunit [Heterostelium album PN500]|eukprot:XP_020433630.1 DNA polymerase alpha primase subunit [Heterostelium album PN500]